MILDVVDGGLLTTIQDAGRRDWTHVGVPESGAADPRGLAVANVVIGNEAGAAALEITVGGTRLRARTRGLIGLAGADLGARLVGARRLAVGRSHPIEAGEEITFDGASDADDGVRAYLAIRGGVDVPAVLGSRSTCLPGGFGGLEGRALKRGDRLAGVGRDDPGADDGAAGLAWPASRREGEDEPSGAEPGDRAQLRFIPWTSDAGDALSSAVWVVGAAADRVGVRLDGAVLPSTIAGEALTAGVPWGAIQVPPDGRPIVLSVDHQTTGGYRVAGVVIAADRHVVGQLGPRRRVRFEEVSLDEADDALRAERSWLAAGSAAVREAARWHAAAARAGG